VLCGPTALTNIIDNASHRDDAGDMPIATKTFEPEKYF
jgi:hypothetical protein